MRRLVPLLLLALACDAWDPQHERPWSLLPAVALESRVAFVETANARVFLVDPADEALRPRIVDVGKSPAVAVRRRGKDELLVLSRGERGEPGLAPEPADLSVVPADGSEPRRFPLGSRFNALAQSDDGRFAIAHFARGTIKGETLFNPNEIAIVDLGPTPGAMPTVTPRTIRSFGGVPTAVVFSPQLMLPEGPRTLAVLLSDNYVTILDLDNPSSSEITVPLLVLAEDRRMLRPVQVLFQSKDPTIFVRVEGSDDIYAMRLLAVPAAERAPGSADFRPALSLLAAGSRPADMAGFDAGDGPRLLVVSGSGDAFVIDAPTSRTTRLPLDAPANRISVFEATGPGDPKPRLRALLLGTGLGSRLVGFLDLERLEEQRTRNLDSRPMGAPALDALTFRERGLVVVLHQSQPGTPGVSVIDLSRRTVAPIFAEANLQSLAVGPPPSEKVWIAPAGSMRLGWIGLGALQPGEVRLDAQVESVLPLAKHVVVVHPGISGNITLLDPDKPERATARGAVGFLLTALLERGDR